MDYKVVLEDAKKELIKAQAEFGECLKQQALIEARIIALRQTIVAFSKLLHEEFNEEDTLGLTDAIRRAFTTGYGTSLTALEVRGALESLGYDISRYGNFMASVHSVLNRLVSQKWIQQIETRDGKPAFAVAPAPVEVPKVTRMPPPPKGPR
jgi:hypothetical protein